MSDRVVAVVQARLGSQRYPSKVLADICGKPMIAHVVQRVKAVRGLDWVALAVPYDEDWGGLHTDIPPCAFPGHANDVLRRMWSAARSYSADVVVRVTGDCPLLSPDLCERVIAERATPYAWNVAEGYVDGTDCEAMTMAAWNTRI